MSDNYFEYPEKKPNIFQEDPYSYFHNQSFSNQPTRTREEIREIKINVLQELQFNLETLQLKRKKAYFKWLVMTKSGSSLRVLERVLTSSKPSVMKTLWMLRTEWMRRGSYAIRAASEMMHDVVEPMRQKRLRWVFHAISHRVHLRTRIGNALSSLAKASKVKFSVSFEKLLSYKRNWETIQKMRLMSMIREKLKRKQKLAFKELFAQTRMFRPFSLMMKLHEVFKKKQFHNKAAVFRKFNRGNLKKKEFANHLLRVCQKALARQKKSAFSDLDLNCFEPAFKKKGHLVNVLCNLEREKKKKYLEELHHNGKWKELTLRALEHLGKSHNRLEKQLALDKTYMIAKCMELYRKLKGLGNAKDLLGLKHFLGNVKMTQAMQRLFHNNGLKVLDKLVKSKKREYLEQMKSHADYVADFREKVANGMERLDALFGNISKREKLRTFYQLKTGAVVSSKRSFIGKNIVIVLMRLLKKRKKDAFREIEDFGYKAEDQKQKREKDALSRIIMGLRGGNLLSKANALKKLKEVILYKKNIFKDGKRFNVYNKLYHQGGLMLDESESKLAWVLKRLWLNKLDQGLTSIAAFSRFHLYKTMRGFREDDEIKRRKGNMLKMSRVLTNIFFKKRLQEGNQLMVKLKDFRFMMKRVYRDQTQDDHGDVVKNTIIIANLIKNYRNKQMTLIAEYFDRWKEETWEFEYEGSDEFEDEMLEVPQNQFYGSIDITKSTFSRAHPKGNIGSPQMQNPFE